MLFLGFLKFLKRDKKKDPDLGLERMEDLDVPPPPPGLGEKELKELPELPEKLAPEMGEKPLSDIGLPKEELQELELPEEKPIPGLELPSLPSPKKEEPIVPKAEFPEPPEVIPSMQKPQPIFPAQKPVAQKPRIFAPKFPPRPKPEIRPYERLERAAVREEISVLRHKTAVGPVYIRADKYKNILNNARIMKNDLKTASQSIVKLDEIDTNRDKVFEKWHKVMMDLQKKLIFIDKTLFKR